MSDSPLATLVDLVAGQGMDRSVAATIAVYVADRCAGISLASAHSSPHSALCNDEFLTGRLALSRPQVSAWLALVRGTREVRRRGRIVGGHPGFVEAAVRGPMNARQRQRFTQLARRAARGEAGARCRPAPPTDAQLAPAGPDAGGPRTADPRVAPDLRVAPGARP